MRPSDSEKSCRKKKLPGVSWDVKIVGKIILMIFFTFLPWNVFFHFAWSKCLYLLFLQAENRSGEQSVQGIKGFLMVFVRSLYIRSNPHPGFQDFQTKV